MNFLSGCFPDLLALAYAFVAPKYQAAQIRKVQIVVHRRGREVKPFFCRWRVLMFVIILMFAAICFIAHEI